MRKLILIAATFLATTGTAHAVAPCPGVEPWSFGDVAGSDPFCTAITAMAQKGITAGCQVVDANNHLYCPADFVRRDQMAGFMNRLANAVGADQLTGAINTDGSLARGRHATTSQKLSTGTYEVAFDRDVTSCAYTVTVGEAGIGSAVPAQTGVTRRAGNSNGLFIRIANAAGEATDKPFYVLVLC